MAQITDMVRMENEDGIAVVTIENPPVNALSEGVRNGLYDAVSTADADDSVIAILIIHRVATGKNTVIRSLSRISKRVCIAIKVKLCSCQAVQAVICIVNILITIIVDTITNLGCCGVDVCIAVIAVRVVIGHLIRVAVNL